MFQEYKLVLKGASNNVLVSDGPNYMNASRAQFSIRDRWGFVHMLLGSINLGLIVRVRWASRKTSLKKSHLVKMSIMGFTTSANTSS